MADKENKADTPAKYLSKEEREKRYEELRNRLSQSRIYVKPPAGVACRWVRREDSNDISYHEWMGFVIAKDDPEVPKDKRRFQTAIPIRSDGTYIIGDVILMECSEDDYKFFIDERLKAANATPQAAKEGFRQNAEQREVPTFERNKSGAVIRS